MSVPVSADTMMSLNSSALEALCLEVNRVDVRNQVRHGVVAALIRRGFVDGVLGLAGDFDLRVSDGSPRGVSEPYR